MMKSLRLLSTLLVLLFSGAATANPLYSWTTKDGTPTYSPDPPPKGVSYVIVGPDLQPLQGQPVTPTTQAQPIPNSGATNSAASGNLVLTPEPGSKSNTANTKASPSSSSKWKPVVYANDPNPKANQPKISAATSTAEPDPVQTRQQVSQVSEECFQVKQKMMLLESQFANALTAQQMDDAIVRLNVFRNKNKGYCGL